VCHIQPESRASFKKLVGRSWTDGLRHLHPAERIYTFWHYMRVLRDCVEEVEFDLDE
jgi:exonuclease III